MRIDRLYLKDVGPFDTLDLTFGAKTRSDMADLHVFVGPNGSGKSTLLYALAELFSWGHLGEDRLTPRMRSEKASVWLGGQGIELVASQQPMSALDASGGALPPWPSLAPRLTSYEKDNTRRVYAHDRDLEWFQRMHDGNGPRGPRSFAAFAYAGQREIGATSITAIQEPTRSAFADALSFNRTVDSGQLALWIASSHAKQALALRDGKTEDAVRFGAAREIVERAVREVVGEELRFEFTYDPIAVTLRRGKTSLAFELLPDGVKSIVSWLADLLMRLERTPWIDDTPLLQRSFLLFLDEIDIHLHPAWQRKVLPMVQRLFPNAQIFVTTHSPFVVSSVSGAWVYPLVVRDGVASAQPKVPTQAGTSYVEVLRTIFDVPEQFDQETERELDRFYVTRDAVLAGARDRREELQRLGNTLGSRGVEVADIISAELAQVDARIGHAA